MNNHSTKTARGGKFPRDISRRAHLHSQTLRNQEQDFQPSRFALAALEAHANVWLAAVRSGRPIAAVRRAI